LARLSNEFKVGLTVIGAVLVAFVGFRTMRDVPLFRQSNQIKAKFSRVYGLNPGSYVYINGVKVGSVKKVNLMRTDSVSIVMSLDLDTDIPKGSMAYIRPVDLLGSKAIIIERSDSRENVPYGGSIQGKYVEGMVETLKDKGDKLGGDISQSFGKFNDLMERLNMVIDKKNRSQLSQTLVNLQTTSSKISNLMEERQDELNNSILHANSILKNIDTLSTSRREDLDSLIVNLRNASSELEVLSGDLKHTTTGLNEILDKINNGEGSMGKLVNDPSLYQHLDSLSSELTRLVRGINEDPGRYLKHMRLVDVF